MRAAFNQNGGSLSATSLSVASGGNSTGVFNQQGGTASFSGSVNLGTNNGDTGTFNQTSGSTTFGSDINVGVNSGSVGYFNQSGGTVSITGGGLFLGEANGATGTMKLSGGTFTDVVGLTVGYDGTGVLTVSAGTLDNSTSTYAFSIGSLADGQGTVNLSGTGVLKALNLDVGFAGTGFFNQTGGTGTYGGFYVGYETGSSGVYNLKGGTLSAGSNEFVGDTGTGTFTQTGGSNTVASGQQLLIGYNSGGSGTYNLQGGTLNAPNVDVGDAGTATLTLSGTGTATVPGTVDIGYYSGGIGTVNLNTGGRLQVGTSVDGYQGTSVFNFNGGTLQATASSANFVYGLTTANVQVGGAKIDTQTFNVTVPQTLVSGTSAGTADGGLTKLGGGTLILTGANTYTGVTTVDAGTLAANNTSGSATGTGAVNVRSGGTLAGNGTISGAVTVENGGTLAPGELAVSRLTLGSNLTLNSGATLAITLGGTTAATGYDQVKLMGALTLGGNLSVSTVNGFSLAVGQTFVILDDTGTSLTRGVFANVTAGLVYTDAAGDTFLVNYAAISDNDAVPNDVTLTVASVVPEPST